MTGMTSGVAPNNSQRSINQPNNSVSKNNTKNSTERNKGTNADIRKKLTNIIANPTTSNNEIPPSNSSENTIPLLNPPNPVLKHKGDQLIGLLKQKKNNPQIKKILKANGGIEGLEADIKAGKGDLDKFLHDIKAYLTMHDAIESWSGKNDDRESVFSEQDKLFEGCSDEWRRRAEMFVKKFKDENISKKKGLKEFGDRFPLLCFSFASGGNKDKTNTETDQKISLEGLEFTNENSMYNVENKTREADEENRDGIQKSRKHLKAAEFYKSEKISCLTKNKDKKIKN